MIEVRESRQEDLLHLKVATHQHCPVVGQGPAGCVWKKVADMVEVFCARTLRTGLRIATAGPAFSWMILSFMSTLKITKSGMKLLLGCIFW